MISMIDYDDDDDDGGGGGSGGDGVVGGAGDVTDKLFFVRE